MVDKVEICNEALLTLGADTIGDLVEDTNAARACNAVFSQVRDRVLYDHPWNFALRRAALAALGTPPLFGWSTQYSLPTDPYCLRVWQVGELDQGIKWRVEGRNLLTNSSGEQKILYIARVEDTGDYSPGFVEAFAALLAHVVALRVTKSRTLKSEMWKVYKEKIGEVRPIDAQEGTPDEPFADVLLNARL